MASIVVRIGTEIVSPGQLGALVSYLKSLMPACYRLRGICNTGYL